MNCLNHPEAPAIAYCRECGKALCETCRRQADGTVYCEEHWPDAQPDAQWTAPPPPVRQADPETWAPPPWPPPTNPAGGTPEGPASR